MAAIATSTTLTTVRTQQHPRYYLNGGDLHLLIRGQLFRVHSYFFDRDSTKFLPVPSCGHDARGYSDETPVIVDVDPVKFEKLLWVFYNPTYSLYDASTEDWADILELAHEWSFTQVKRLAIRELQKLPMPTAERIALYLKYNINCEFLVPLYTELCSRTESLSLEEADLIGMPVAIILFQLREELRTRPPPPASPLPNGITQTEVRQRVVTAFGFPPEAANQQAGGVTHLFLTIQCTDVSYAQQPPVHLAHDQSLMAMAVRTSPAQPVAGELRTNSITPTTTPRPRRQDLLVEAQTITKLCSGEAAMGWGLLPRMIALVVLFSVHISC